MRRAAEFFGPEEQTRIETAVARAEEKTTAEIVPVVARASGRYDRAEDIIGLWCGVVLMAKVWWFFPRAGDAAMWSAPWEVLLLPAMIAAVITGFIIGAKVGARFHALRYFFIPKSEMRAEVLSRAQRAFLESGAGDTTHRTGVVVYVSISERLAAVVASARVHEALGQTLLDELAGELAAGIRDKRGAAAFEHIVAPLGDQLAETFPRAANDTDELPNRLVLIEDIV